MKRLIQRLQKEKVFIVVGLAMAFGFIFLLNALFTIQLKFDNRELAHTILELENEVKSLHQENQKSTTDEEIEKQATSRLGMIKSGEMPVKVQEVQPNVQMEEYAVAPEQKISIYFKDWYEDLEQWVEDVKK